MAFAGYLIKLGGSGGTELPLDYLRVESYTAVTNLTENASMKSVTGRKYRQMAEHKAVQVSFQSKSMDNTSLAALNAMILAAMSDQSSRDITLEYYDPETDTYKEADCYMPEVPFTIRKIEDQNTVIFSPAQYTFIEY